MGPRNLPCVRRRVTDLSAYRTGKPGEEHAFMFDERLSGKPGAFVATAASVPIEDATGDQHAFSAGDIAKTCTG